MDSAAIATLLPGIFQSALHPAQAGIVEPDRRLAALLGVMETLQEPVEDVLDGLHHHLDPRQAPPRFVPFLAGWVDLDWLLLATPDQPSATATPLASGMGHLRELVAAAVEIARWRGTAGGLLRFLDTATGIPGFAVEENVTGDPPTRGPSTCASSLPRRRSRINPSSSGSSSPKSRRTRPTSSSS